MNDFWRYAKIHQDQAIYYFDPQRLLDGIQLWTHNFPGIQPYYAVKCNTYPAIIKILKEHHFSFDCASQNEIKCVQSLGVDVGHPHPPLKGVQQDQVPSVIYANPFKFPSHLEFADHVGVRLMTADCPEELDKIHHWCPSAEVLLRIAVDDSYSICQFNSKFGMIPTESNLKAFFDKRQELNVKVVGVSFHVGSGCLSEKSYQDALQKTRSVFDLARQEYSLDLKVIDLGGGFMQNEPILSKVSETILKHLESLFEWTPKDSKGLFVMAEPGRFFATNVFDLYVQVIGKNQVLHKYYVNDGVYGAFNCKVFDYAVFDYVCYDTNGQIIDQREKSLCTVFGPTCDSLDKILEKVTLPQLQVGDYLCFLHMGAYTLSASSQFNGMPLAVVYTGEVVQ